MLEPKYILVFIDFLTYTDPRTLLLYFLKLNTEINIDADRYTTLTQINTIAHDMIKSE